MGDERAVTALAEIRALELEMARRLDEARAAAEQAVAEARTDARRRVAEARERGARRAEERHRERVGAAVAEAAEIRRAGQAEADRLLAELRPGLLALVDELLAIVVPVGIEEDGTPCSSR